MSFDNKIIHFCNVFSYEGHDCLLTFGVSVVYKTSIYTVSRYPSALIILWFSKLVASDQHGLVMLSLGYLIYVLSMCQL